MRNFQEMRVAAAKALSQDSKAWPSEIISVTVNLTRSSTGAYRLRRKPATAIGHCRRKARPFSEDGRCVGRIVAVARMSGTEQADEIFVRIPVSELPNAGEAP